jgi:hypothetical protein
MMNSYETINIKISIDDIFEYAVGNSVFCPIERQIDSERYATYDPFIYDSIEKRMIDQDPFYKYFSEQVSKLRSLSSDMSAEEVYRVCEELEEIAPRTIKL